MVIGDDLIHIYESSRCGHAPMDRVPTHRVCPSDMSGHCGSASASPTTACLDPISSFHLAHQECEYHFGKDHYFDFRMFETSRHIYQEAFLIFWRTSRFAFEKGDVLTTFLRHLTEAQTHNIKSLVISHLVYSFSLKQDWYPKFEEVMSDWKFSFTPHGRLPSLKSLKNVELHLNLICNGHGMDVYPRTFRTNFKAFESLRLLSLNEVSVTLSITSITDGSRLPIRFEDSERIPLATSFRNRLLNPTIIKQDLADTLQDEFERLEYSLKNSEGRMKCLQHELECLKGVMKTSTRGMEGFLRLVASNKAQADQQRKCVRQDKDEVHRLHTALSRNDPSEMSKEIQLRTGEYLELSGRDGENVAG